MMYLHIMTQSCEIADVCKLRLDFESFSLLGTGNTQEVVPNTANTAVTEAGGDCLDTFDVTTNTGQRIPQVFIHCDLN